MKCKRTKKVISFVLIFSFIFAGTPAGVLAASDSTDDKQGLLIENYNLSSNNNYDLINNQTVPGQVSMQPAPQSLSNFIKFSAEAYSLELPYTGSSTLQISAQAMDGEGKTIANAVVTYSLKDEYEGVTINGSTGIITVTSGAKQGEVSIIASYGQRSAITKVNLKIVNPKAIEAGYHNSFYIKEDNTAWAWGNNMYRTLGDGTTEDKITPIKVLEIENPIQISSKFSHALALQSDGTVWSWGNYNQGQLGLVIKETTAAPEQADGLNGVIQVAAGSYHSLALKSDGSVWGCGEGGFPDLDKEDRTYFRQIEGLNNIIQVAAGDNHSLALKSDGTVWAFGYNDYGQLGDGTQEPRLTPIQVKGLTNVIAIDAGYFYSLALKSDGTVWCWGQNNRGQLGDGTTIDSASPVQAYQLHHVIKIAAGDYHALALKSDQTVWSWGANEDGELGDGTAADQNIPVQVRGLIAVADLAAGAFHSLALGKDGVLWAWGSNSMGQLGISEPIECAVIPVRTLIGREKEVLPEGTSILFAQGSYSSEVSKLESTTIMVSAKLFGRDGTEIPGNITYALAAPYPGVSINPATGTVTISPEAAAGTVTITATAEGLTASTQLILTKAEGAQTKLTIDTVSGKQYDISLLAKEIQSISSRLVTLKYDAAIFELVDLCVFTSQKELSTGAITGTGLTITKVAPGEIQFTLDKEIPGGKLWSGTMDVIRLKAKKAASSTLEISQQSQ